MGKVERKRLVKAGIALGTLTEEDIDYIMDFAHSENEVLRRMTTARRRSIFKEMCATA